MKAEAADLSAEALTVAGETTDPERLAIAYTMGGMLAFDTHRFGESPLWLRKAADLADQVPEPRSPVLRLTRPLSLLFSEPLGIANQPEAFDDAVGDPDPWVSAIARIIRAQVAINAGCELDQAEADFRAAAATFEVIGERWIGAAALGGGLALMESRRGDFAAAIAHYEQAVALAAEIGSTEDEGHFRVNMARMLWASGQRERAEAELDRALRDAERTGSGRRPGQRAPAARPGLGTGGANGGLARDRAGADRTGRSCPAGRRSRASCRTAGAERDGAWNHRPF
jgi:tetratricopeptide (TPR) repeat protein